MPCLQTILIDLSGFRLANFDLKPLKFLMRTLEEHYPDSVGLILVHNAPFGAKSTSHLPVGLLGIILGSQAKTDKNLD